MDQRRHRRDAELPFEAEPDVGHDAGDGEQDRERAGLRQFAGDARADHLDAREIVVGGAEGGTGPCSTTACCACSPPGWAATRMSTSAALPMFWTWTSPSPRPSTLRADRADVGGVAMAHAPR